MSQYAYDPYVPVRQTNGLGLAGFICSLVGLLVTGGLLCPIGLILSIAALGRQPRGFAIAGLILGLLGTCGGILVVVLLGGAILAALGIAAVAFMYTQGEKLELSSDMVTIGAAVQKYRDEFNYLPAGLEVLSIDESRLIDPWGKRYDYEKIDPQRKFDIVSAGKDKMFGTEDDVRLSALDEMWSKVGDFSVSASQGDGGVVKIDLGNTSINAAGNGGGGKVTIDLGGRVIEVNGNVEPSTTTAPSSTSPAEPAVPQTQPE